MQQPLPVLTKTDVKMWIVAMEASARMCQRQEQVIPVALARMGIVSTQKASV